MPPTAHEFRAALRRRFARATEEGRTHVDIRSGDLHTAVGDYPNRGNDRMENWCRVMRNEMTGEDAELDAPPKGVGASLVIRYTLPRNA